MNGADRHVEDLSNLFVRKTAEEDHLDQFALAGIEFGQLAHGIVEIEKFLNPLLGNCKLLIESYLGRASPTFGAAERAGVIDQKATHHAGRYGEEMGAISERDLSIDQA